MTKVFELLNYVDRRDTLTSVNLINADFKTEKLHGSMEPSGIGNTPCSDFGTLSSEETGEMGEHSEASKHCGLPLASRLILYGLCGFFTEVMFTATWYFVDSARYHHGWKLHGCTSVWSFPIYAVSSLVVERLYLFLNGKVSLLVRGIIYVKWTYFWEFVTGLILRQFNACPWDYRGYTYFNIMGLITLDYAPLWFLGSLLLETVVIQSALQLQYSANAGRLKAKEF